MTYLVNWLKHLPNLSLFLLLRSSGFPSTTPPVLPIWLGRCTGDRRITVRSKDFSPCAVRSKDFSPCAPEGSTLVLTTNSL
ncbi:MAG: hypothetical protein GDA43_10880 [Hormoscilla sp. SP5CHS1]|nr:hypothetical protein [Hormoscilla sp. SP5CHS1]